MMGTPVESISMEPGEMNQSIIVVPIQSVPLPSNPTQSNDILSSLIELFSNQTDLPQIIMLVRQCIREPSIHQYNRLMNLSAIQLLHNSSEPQSELYYNILYILSYGTLYDYHQSRQNKQCIELTGDELYKLKQLTLITLLQSTTTVSYDTIQQQCELTCIRDIENLCIDCMYNNLCIGKLNQLQKQFVVYNCMSRPVQPIDTQFNQQLIDLYTAYTRQCTNVIQLIQSYQSNLTQFADAQYQQQEKYHQLKLDKIRYLQSNPLSTTNILSIDTCSEVSPSANNLASRFSNSMKSGLRKIGL